MAQTGKFRKGKSLFATTLSTSIGTGTSDTITLNSTSGLPTDTEITLTFNRVDSDGVVQPTSAIERITGTIVGSTLTSYTRGIDGTTEQAHGSGVVVEYIPNADDMNDLVDGILAQHSQTGTHTDITATTLSLTQNIDLATGKGIRDGNDNEVLKIVQTSSAINEVSLTNAATGNGPIISATGDDTNIDLKLLSKGTGTLSVTGTTDYENNVSDDDDIPNKKWVSDNAVGSTDGWQAAGETWTYASASTFTIAGVDVTTKYTTGTRLKFTQTTAKYAVVLSSSFSTNTTVTILVNTDHTIANATITSPYYSYQANPQGYPTFFNISSTITNQGGSWTNAPTVNYAKLALTGKSATVAIKWTYHATSGGTGSVRASLPVTPARDGAGFGVETNNIVSLAVVVDAGSTRFTVQKYDGSSPIGNSLVDLVEGVFEI